MSLEKQRMGKYGEGLAANYLVKNGYVICEQNVRSRRGEIDLIATDGTTLVFVEVRTRRGNRFGTPVESVTWRKRQKLRELALDYLQRSNQPTRRIRFDVISIMIMGETSVQIEHISHAF